MGPAATPRRDSAAPAVWRRTRACSGVTSRLILSYVERECGRRGVEEVLARSGLAAREAELHDENSWFSFEEKIALWDAAAAVTGDPRVAEHAGEAALELSVALGLKRALRALGSPELVLRNVARANRKFNWAHTLEVVDREPGQARLCYQDAAGVGYHRYDCEYTAGLLRTIPELFGLPRARVSHPVCGARGGEHCVFDVRWATALRTSRLPLALALTAVALAAGDVALQAAWPAAASAASGAAALGLSLRRGRVVRAGIRALESRVREQDEAADAQLDSLAALASELRLEEVLDRIARSATSTVGGAEFALLIDDAGRMRADRCSSLPPERLEPLERWAQDARAALRSGTQVIDDLAAVPALAPLAQDDQRPLGSACAVPLCIRDRLLGVLVALAPGATVFLPHDVRELETYARHAAIALSNARLVDQLEREASEDPLTRLANKRAFELAYAAETSRAAREGKPLAVVVIDVDHFKAINDRHGHPYGDRVLIDVAGALRAAVREYDTVARLGGDEFAALLPGADEQEAHEVAERARALIAEIRLPDARPLSSSAGVAAVPASLEDGAALLQTADQALYQAKRRGRGRTELLAL